MAKKLGYIGSILMVIFSFTLNPIFAILGLSLITCQTFKLKAHNMTALNIISIGGFIFQII